MWHGTSDAHSRYRHTRQRSGETEMYTNYEQRAEIDYRRRNLAEAYRGGRSRGLAPRRRSHRLSFRRHDQRS
jgi:hypothetical protein